MAIYFGLHPKNTWFSLFLKDTDCVFDLCASLHFRSSLGIRIPHADMVRQ